MCSYNNRKDHCYSPQFDDNYYTSNNYPRCNHNTRTIYLS